MRGVSGPITDRWRTNARGMPAELTWLTEFERNPIGGCLGVPRPMPETPESDSPASSATADSRAKNATGGGDSQASRGFDVDLRNPWLAGLLAWLVPGAGHFYQRRFGKGALFMTCVLGTYFYGLSMGQGHVVYASWKKEDRRWQYLCQVGVGLPALPAIVQNKRVMAGQPPLVADVLAPPTQPVLPNDKDALAMWHEEGKWRFDLGTLYTMIAGLMNIMAVFDAFAGPYVVPVESESKDGKKKKPESNSSGSGSSARKT